MNEIMTNQEINSLMDDIYTKRNKVANEIQMLLDQLSFKKKLLDELEQDYYLYSTILSERIKG